MDGMHGEQQSGHERRSLRLWRSPENRLQQQVQQPSDCRVQHEIKQVKPERLPSIHRLIPCQRSKRDRSKHVADLVRRKQRSHRGHGHLGIVRDVESVVHGELVQQCVAVNERHYSQQQNDTETFLHSTPTPRHGLQRSDLIPLPALNAIFVGILSSTRRFNTRGTESTEEESLIVAPLRKVTLEVRHPQLGYRSLQSRDKATSAALFPHRFL